MKSRYRLTQRATEDLGNIWDYIARDDPLAADAFITSLLDVAERLADTPRMGRKRDDLALGLRSLPHGEYLVFYTIQHDTVEIFSIVHGGRDLRTLFDGGA